MKDRLLIAALVICMMLDETRDKGHTSHARNLNRRGLERGSTEVVVLTEIDHTHSEVNVDRKPDTTPLAAPPPATGAQQLLEKPEISIVLSVYNEREYVDDSLKNILQVVGNRKIELIVVDDHSQDGTLARLQSFDAAPVNIISHTRNLGHRECLMSGVLEAKGTYVVMLSPYEARLLFSLDLLVSRLKEPGSFSAFVRRFDAGASLFQKLFSWLTKVLAGMTFDFRSPLIGFHGDFIRDIARTSKKRDLLINSIVWARDHERRVQEIPFNLCMWPDWRARLAGQTSQGPDA